MQHALRLRREADFARLRTTGRQWRHSLLTLSCAPNALPHNRYGFITSRRLGGAVQRNRARRLMREAIRLAHGSLKQGYDIALIAREPIVGQDWNTVRTVIETMCRRAALWQE